MLTAMLTSLDAGNGMEGVGCFELRNLKSHSVGCIYLVADTVRSCVLVVR